MSAGVLNFLPHCPSLQTQFLNVKSMARRWQEKTSPQPHQATPREASPGGSLAASPSQRESSESCIASSPVTHDDDATPSGDWEPEQHADDEAHSELFQLAEALAMAHRYRRACVRLSCTD